MIITAEQICKKQNFISSIVLHGLSKNKDLLKKASKNKKVDFRILIDGVDVDVEQFIERWQNEVENSVKESAIEISKEKFEEIKDKIDELNNAVEEAIEKAIKIKIS